MSMHQQTKKMEEMKEFYNLLEQNINQIARSDINLKEPCVLYIGWAYCYPSDVAFYIFFSTNISTEYFKHAAYSLFFSFKMPFIS